MANNILGNTRLLLLPLGADLSPTLPHYHYVRMFVLVVVDYRIVTRVDAPHCCSQCKSVMPPFH